MRWSGVHYKINNDIIINNNHLWKNGTHNQTNFKNEKITQLSQHNEHVKWQTNLSFSCRYLITQKLLSKLEPCSCKEIAWNRPLSYVTPLNSRGPITIWLHFNYNKKVSIPINTWKKNDEDIKIKHHWAYGNQIIFIGAVKYHIDCQYQF